MILFEDHSTHGPKDEIGTVTMTVTCHPKHRKAVIEFLSGVKATAGVYSVSVEEEQSHGKQPIQQPGGAGDANDGAGHAPDQGGASAHSDAGKHGNVAGPAGQSGPEPVGGSAKGKGQPEVRGAVTKAKDAIRAGAARLTGKSRIVAKEK